jgi:hypothetical protein
VAVDRRPLGAALVAVVVLAGCARIVGPTRTAQDYELKASATADSVLSAVRTAEIAADAADRGRSFGTTTAVTLADAEAAAEGAAATFASLQPPGPASDVVRDELTAITDDATDVLATLRITARRGDLDALGEQAAPLAGIARELEAFSERHG